MLSSGILHIRRRPYGISLNVPLARVVCRCIHLAGNTVALYITCVLKAKSRFLELGVPFYFDDSMISIVFAMRLWFSLGT